jgi:hypothetical protein
MNSEEFAATLGNIPGWRKSSYSDADCVEVNSSLPGYTFIRDSKVQIDNLVLAFEPDQMRAFLLRTKRGEFDSPSA